MAAERPAGAWVPPEPVLEPLNPALTKPPEQRVSGHDLGWSAVGAPLLESVDYFGVEGGQG